MPTIDQVIAIVKAEIKELDLRLNRWQDTRMPAYRGTIKLIQDKQAYLAGLLRQRQEQVRSNEDTDSRMPPTKGKRERGPDYEKSRDRVALEDGLRSELGTINSRKERYTTVNELKKEFPRFQLWEILSSKEQEELLTEEFKPVAYARTLVMRKYGLTNPETIKKDRQKLRKGNK